MSAPNRSYDPKQVAVLSPEQVEAARSAALAAFEAAASLEALHAAKVAHLGDRSPLSLARSEIGALPVSLRAAPRRSPP